MVLSQEYVISLGRDALVTVLLVAGPLLLSGLVIGLLVSILQATTQIQEATLSFVPKIVAVMLAALIFGPWMMTIMVEFTSRLLGNLAAAIR